MQSIEVRVEAADPAWSGPLQCTATNAAGRWPFTAPGLVAVRPSASPLRIDCITPAGTAAATSKTAPRVGDEARADAHQGSVTGAKVGSGAGVALGVAAAPVMGPAFALALVVGGALKGAQIGGIVGAMSSSGRMQYPSPIVLRIERAPVVPEPASAPLP